jgi:mannose-6-phosphate isomerase-like protein (cupin superfamily)
MKMIDMISIESAEHYFWGEKCDGWHLLKNSECSVIQERMPPGTSEVAHYHHKSRQFFYVLSGKLSILLNEQLHILNAEQGLEVPPKAAHRVFNKTDADVRFLVVSSPPSHRDRTAC